jgi:3-dehydroquinate synthase
MRGLIVNSKISNYELWFVHSINDIVNETVKPNTITFVDSTVAQLYTDLNKDEFVLVECNEETKTINGSKVIIDTLIERKANTRTKLVVVGGGVLQDLIGYCASIYCRGIEYLLVPTTLLAQADSCIGGKTSINHGGKKNILGNFYPPSKILIDTNFTRTLTTQDFISGLGEVYKFHILQNKVSQFDPNKSVEEMVYDGLKYKIDILSRDEFDKGERRFLNFGHTFGHALEAVSDYRIPHGIAVILGCMISTLVSTELGYCVADLEDILSIGNDLIRRSNVQLEKAWFEFSALQSVIKSDKKSTGKLTMVLMNDGQPILTDVDQVDIIQPILSRIYGGVYESV